MRFPQPSVLLTDLYQLTMLQAYHRHRMFDVAVFEFFVRKLPADRNFFVAAGLEHVLDYLESLHFEPDELDWLAKSGRFQPEFLQFLAQLRFTGDVHAMPEGTVFFPNEPILRVTAPMPEAQLVETRIINLLQFQTLIASKAARCVLVAPGKVLVDFGMRRAHGAEAGLLAARATYLAGFTSTATVAAGALWHIPISGTMAHSFVQAHHDEAAAFADFAVANPNDVVLLIDTYDTEAAARKVVELAPRLKQQGIRVRGVRLDSGDLAEHARQVRRILNDGGLADTTIFASGNLDEFAVAKLLAANAPIDGFGIGTRVDVSSDAPYLDCAYKLQEYAGQPRRKTSEGKATWPGRKQVFRESSPDGCIARDHVSLESSPESGQPLLSPVMRNGRRVQPSESLAAIRQRSAEQLAALPASLRALDIAEPQYEVRIGSSLRDLAAQMDRQMSKTRLSREVDLKRGIAVPATDDSALLRQASGGDFDAFTALVERFQTRVFASARRIVGNQHDAEDVTQQTFLSVLDHLGGFREESSVATWILRIATNHALKVLRKRRGLPTVSIDSRSENGEDSYAALPHPEFIAQWRDEPARLAQQQEVRQLIESTLDELPDKYRVVFVLRDVEGLSVKETAETLGLTESNVKVRLLRARLDLRERLTRALGDEATRMFPGHDHDG